MAPKSRKKNASDAPSSSQIPDTSPEPTYDAIRFKSLAHERHFEEVKKMGIQLLREFYANARMARRDKQSNPRYMTFVRGKDIDFSPTSIKVILQLPDIDDSEQSYEARRQDDDQRLNEVLRDIGEPFAQWKLDNKKKPNQINRQELNPTARGWFDFVRRSLIPSSNISEVTVER
ncbi:hypothetical protein PIB30_046878 [Stylosanthes scabra]|uniref:Putative plant transposon protein domain-containing protein n=1 Tax=Stylosanthes scabra TaxID=79078 RepID=A0ABU6SHS2_9FABA|nr:hypothetical protein [Stylosanthes scabra]